MQICGWLVIYTGRCWNWPNTTYMKVIVSNKFHDSCSDPLILSSTVISLDKSIILASGRFYEAIYGQHLLKHCFVSCDTIIYCERHGTFPWIPLLLRAWNPRWLCKWDVNWYWVYLSDFFWLQNYGSKMIYKSHLLKFDFVVLH